MAHRCEVCNQPITREVKLAGGHHCSPKSLDRYERRIQEHHMNQDPPEPGETLDDRLQDAEEMEHGDEFGRRK